MSDRLSEILGESRLSLNYIPSGRQLSRTPPRTGVKKQLDFEDCEEQQQSVAETSRDDDDQNRTFDINTSGIKSEPDDPNSMLKGMKGYQLTQTDLEFIEKMRVEKCVKKLQGDLEEAQRLLMKEMMALELALASRDKAQAERQTFPSCDDLKMTSPSTELTALDAKSLLTVVMEKNIGRAKEKRRPELTRLEKRVATKRKEAHARGQLERQVAHEQLKIQGLISQLTDLKSQLLHQADVYKALEMQLNAQESPKITAKEVDAPEEPQAAKRHVNRRGTGRTKALESTEKLQDTTNQSKSTRSKPRDRRAGVKADRGSENTSGTLKPKRKKKARTPSQEVETNAQESAGAVRGSGKSLGTSPPRVKHPSRAKAGEATSRLAAGAAGDETQPTVLRRSKRIASRAGMYS